MTMPIDRVVEELQAIRKQLGGTNEGKKICVMTATEEIVHQRADEWIWHGDFLSLYVEGELCAQYQQSFVISVAYTTREE